MRAALERVWAGAMDLVFAPVCVGCRAPIPAGAAQRVVCALCWTRCRAVPAPRCGRCGAPVPTDVARGDGDAPPGPGCRACRGMPPTIRAVRSAFAMGGTVRRLVHALKYDGWEAAAEPMAARMAALAWPADVEAEAAVVVPVPTTAARIRRRGYNQAARLAAHLARLTGRSFDPEILVRTRAAATQTALHPDERRANVAGAFAVPPGRAAGLRGAHVLLVDDVWTTGATARECAETLVEAGARVASVATFARVFPELDR